MRPPHLATTAAAVLVVLALAGSVLLLVAGTGAGTSPSGGPVPLPSFEAVRIAQRAAGGHAPEVEREDEHGRQEWKVRLSTGAEIRIDVATGVITRRDRSGRG
jgi:hypothetical protein